VRCGAKCRPATHRNATYPYSITLLAEGKGRERERREKERRRGKKEGERKGGERRTLSPPFRFSGYRIYRILSYRLQSFRSSPTSSTRRVIITGTPNFQGQNLVNMRFICTKIYGARQERMMREVLPELSTICTALPCNVSLNVTSL